MQATYILPIRRHAIDANDDLPAYLRWLAGHIDVVVVDGSPPMVFQAHAEQWGDCVRHIPPDPDLVRPNGKVGGVLTGIRHALYERLVIADDDVRYDASNLRRIVEMLDQADVIRPQNYFDPLPWHARWDTARSLLNRISGGDWPGTLAVRRSLLERTNGYAGDVLFENLELVRTVRAAGGREAVPLDLFVRRLPPSADHFWSQRVRQAYDEFARPLRLLVWLAVLPLSLALLIRRRWAAVGEGLGAIIALAESGRWRGNGRRVFPISASLLAPAWVAERSVCSWLAVAVRLRYGGVAYHGGRLKRAATPMRVLQRRYAHVRADASTNERDQQRCAATRLPEADRLWAREVQQI